MNLHDYLINRFNLFLLNDLLFVLPRVFQSEIFQQSNSQFLAKCARDEHINITLNSHNLWDLYSQLHPIGWIYRYEDGLRDLKLSRALSADIQHGYAKAWIYRLFSSSYNNEKNPQEKTCISNIRIDIVRLSTNFRHGL